MSDELPTGDRQAKADAVLRAAEDFLQTIRAERRLREASGPARDDLKDIKETLARIERIVLEMLDRENRNGHL
jgi:hypothetical protein